MRAVAACKLKACVAQARATCQSTNLLNRRCEQELCSAQACCNTIVDAKCCHSCLQLVTLQQVLCVCVVATMSFTIRTNVTVVESGSMKTCWVVEPMFVDGAMFLELHKSDRGLARALGLCLSDRCPFRNTTLFEHIAMLRNEAVTKFMVDFQLASDPMADDAARNVKVNMVNRSRDRSFQQAKVPQVIEIDLEGFQHVMGGTTTDVPARSVKVLATSRVDKSISVELNACTLDWLCKAIYVPWRVPGPVPTLKRKWYDDLTLPDLPDGAKYRRRAQSLSISAPYYDGTAWKFVQKSVSKSVSPDTLKEYVLGLADRVLTLSVAAHKDPGSVISRGEGLEEWGSDDNDGGDAGNVAD